MACSPRELRGASSSVSFAPPSTCKSAFPPSSHQHLTSHASTSSAFAPSPMVPPPNLPPHTQYTLLVPASVSEKPPKEETHVSTGRADRRNRLKGTDPTSSFARGAAGYAESWFGDAGQTGSLAHQHQLQHQVSAFPSVPSAPHSARGVPFTAAACPLQRAPSVVPFSSLLAPAHLRYPSSLISPIPPLTTCLTPHQAMHSSTAAEWAQAQRERSVAASLHHRESIAETTGACLPRPLARPLARPLIRASLAFLPLLLLLLLLLALIPPSLRLTRPLILIPFSPPLHPLLHHRPESSASCLHPRHHRTQPHHPRLLHPADLPLVVAR